MATHDYVIANGTGAAVRSDLNDALAAIVSNNSGSSEPGTTYAYQWWADTTANVLKIRNSANNAWITLRELDGTMLIEDGSEGSPGLAFADDTNTGLFSPAADNIAFTTGGGERLRINNTETVLNEPSADIDFRVESNGNTHMLFVDGGNNVVGIGTSSPGCDLEIGGTGHIHIADQGRIGCNSGAGAPNDSYIKFFDSDIISFHTTDTERARIDSSGRLLLGTSSATDYAGGSGYTPKFQFRGSGEADSSIAVANADGNGILVIVNEGGSSVISDDEDLGKINFKGYDGNSYPDFAQIKASVDGTPGDNDCPGRLTFSTTADGASSPTERVRIDSSGNCGIGVTSPQGPLHVGRGSGNAKIFIQRTNAAANTDDYGSIIWRSNGGNNNGLIGVARQSAENDGYMFFSTASGGTLGERLRISSGGSVSIGTSAANASLNIYGGASAALFQNSNTGTGSGDGFFVGNWGGQTGSVWNYENDIINFGTNNSERVRITSTGDVLISKTTSSFGTEGIVLADAGYIAVTRTSNVPLNVIRNGTDGVLVNFEAQNVIEGTISVSGTTVSYNGAHLSRWSQLPSGAERTEILRGSVLSNLDEMCEWAHAAQDAVLYTEEDELPEGVSVGDVKTPAVEAYTEDNEQLNRMKISDVEGDVNVAGVFQAWDDDDDTYDNDFYCAMTGDFVIRIAQGTTVARGDLLMSAGDGTAKPQDDDIVRSKTIAKVTSTTVSTTYSDGSYCVPCVLMAC
jgi:hypothetical protein